MGGSSLIENHLIESLTEDSAVFAVVDDLSSGKIDNLERVQNQYRLIEGDLRWR